MKKGRREFLVAGAAALAAMGSTAIADEQLRVTFVGNSFTLQHDIPALVKEIAWQAGNKIVTRTVARNGARLADHIPDRSSAYDLWRDNTGPQMIVLQPHSTTSIIEQHRNTLLGLKLHFEHAPKTIVFQPWPRQRGHRFYRNPGIVKNPREMVAAFKHLGVLVGKPWRDDRLAPVGQAWLLAEGLPIYAQDGYHANFSGAWLSALVLARTMGLAPDHPVAPDGVRNAERLAQIASLVAP